MASSRWRTALYAAGVLGLGSAILLSGGALISGVGTASGLSGVLGTEVAALGALVSLVLWRRRTAGPAASIPLDAVLQAKRDLAASVLERWNGEARLRDQDGQHPMPVVWRLSGRVPGGGGVVLAGAATYGEADRQARDLADRFLALRPRRLFVVGGPGSGKTTLCMQLLLAILRSAAEANQVPAVVPVPVSASSWAPKYLSEFTTWMADEVGRNYPQILAKGVGMPKRLVEGCHVLPVLDGLDELPATERVKVVQTLGTVVGTGISLLLTCRTEEFEQALRQLGGVLSTAKVIEPDPLTPAAAAAHLRSHLSMIPSSAWEELLTGLEAPGPHTGPLGVIATAAITPLDLGLLRTTYAVPHRSPEGLLRPGFASPAALRGHLLDQLIPALLMRSPPSSSVPGELRPRRAHDPDQVRRHLAFLAYLLVHTPVSPWLLLGQPRGTPLVTVSRDLRWWQLSDLVLPRNILPWVQVLTWIALGILGGAVGGAIAPPAEGVFPDAASGAEAMGYLGLFAGVLSLFFANNARHQTPRYLAIQQFARFRPHPRRALLGRRSVGGALLGGLAGSLLGPARLLAAAIWRAAAGDVPDWLSASVVPVLLGGIIVGAVIGLTTGIYFWTKIAWGENLPGTPTALLRADRGAGLLRLTAIIVILGSLALRDITVAAGNVRETVQASLVFGVIAIGVGLFSGHRAWLAYSVGVSYAAFHREVPVRLMPFLDDAHRLGLLRAVGPVYQFRHAEFQDHLAALYPALPHIPRGPLPAFRSSTRRKLIWIARGGVIGGSLLAIWRWRGLMAGVIPTLIGVLVGSLSAWLWMRWRRGSSQHR